MYYRYGYKNTPSVFDVCDEIHKYHMHQSPNGQIRFMSYPNSVSPHSGAMTKAELRGGGLAGVEAPEPSRAPKWKGPK
jgi:hypothetical protein